MSEIDLEEMRNRVISSIDMSEEIDDGRLHEVIDRILSEYMSVQHISVVKRCEYHKKIFDQIRGLGILDELLGNQEITEIMINGPNCIFIEQKGSIRQIEGTAYTEEGLANLIQKIVGKNNRRVNESNPIADARLEDGSRVNIVLPPVAIDGAAVTIRKFPERQVQIRDLIAWESISKEAADFLKEAVQAGYNIFVSGGTGSGKTTFLNVLSNFIPAEERIITIEDSAELQLKSVKNLIRMETRQENIEGENKITIRDLIKTSLRMRPDRIIVGEVRGPETLDMLQAMNTGHDGSMSTGHANSPKDMLSRLETMVLTGIEMPLPAVRAQIASAIDLIVHLGRIRDKSRKVLEIVEVLGLEDNVIQLRKLFEYEEQGETSNKVIGKLIKKHELKNKEKLIHHGVKI
jgi:pilus assembly protein CpaF